MPDINDVNGNPAIETDQPLSIQEANEWALKARKEADPRKSAIERLKCAAAQRRERKPANPLEVLKPDPSYKAGTFNAEADAFNVESSDGQKLLGKSLSNGNIRDGQKVRAFFMSNNKQAVIDVKPKGRDIVIPKPDAKPPVEEPDIWPCTVAFLYSKLKATQEDFTDNLATDLTSYDAWQSLYYNNSATERVVLFTQRSDTMGDYATAEDALANNLKEDRKLKPGNTGAGSGGAADDAAWGSGSPDAVTVWYYIGNPSDALPNGKIFKVSGPPMHPAAGNVTNPGPGFAMQVYGSGIASAIFPSENIGEGPLTVKLKESFPDLGGTIGYAGRVEKWRGQQDYANSSGVYYFRSTPGPNDTYQTPVSFPPSYVPGELPDPWLRTNANWFQFGWPDPQYIGCASSAWINAESSALTGLGCGGGIPPESWYWGGDATPNYGRIDKDNPGGFIGYQGMFVCWRGHKDNTGLALSFFEAFRTYWGITGSVTVLGFVNPFGCGIGTNPGTGTYPPPPPELQRFLVRQFGRKAEIWLKLCEKDYPPIELKLPFEFAALLEKCVIQGSATFPGGSNVQNRFDSFGSSFGAGYSFCLECPHATMSMDSEFIYIDILYGGEKVWEEPLSKPIPCKLSNLGGGDFTGFSWTRKLGEKENGNVYIIGQYKSPNTVEIAPRYKADYFTYCQSYKVALPATTNRTLTIVGSHKYSRGENIQLTAKASDNEFNNKFLIFDFRTDKLEAIPKPPSVNLPTSLFAPWQASNVEYASFGGLPALLQFQNPGFPITSLAHFNAIEKYYKPRTAWTDIDEIYFHLIGSPESFYPLNTVLPVGEFTAPNTNQFSAHVRYNLDTKFGRTSRACSINRPASFGDVNKTTVAPTYISYSNNGQFLLYDIFKEQLLGNGIKNSAGLITRWNRISVSSFPIFGQVKRNAN